jgi:hypothetical protein
VSNSVLFFCVRKFTISIANVYHWVPTSSNPPLPSTICSPCHLLPLLSASIAIRDLDSLCPMSTRGQVSNSFLFFLCSQVHYLDSQRLPLGPHLLESSTSLYHLLPLLFAPLAVCFHCHSRPRFPVPNLYKRLGEYLTAFFFRLKSCSQVHHLDGQRLPLIHCLLQSSTSLCHLLPLPFASFCHLLPLPFASLCHLLPPPIHFPLPFTVHAH